MQDNHRLRAHLALLTVAIIYGGNFIIAREVMTRAYLHPFVFILLRVAFAALLFWFTDLLWVSDRIPRARLRHLFWCSIFGVGINQLCFFAGLKETTPINASIVMTSSPIIVLLASVLLGKEQLTPLKMAGIIIGGLGALVLITQGHWHIRFQSRGDVLILINATSYGIYLVLVRNMLLEFPAITVIKWVFTFGLIWVIPFGWVHWASTAWSAIPLNAWLGIAYVLIATTYLAYLLNGYALKYVASSTVGIYIYLQPFIAALLATALGIEALTGYKWVAGLLIFTGVFMVSRVAKPANG
ncbi:MAG: DMT family transporter [Saprospiraceae bacterium]|nr:DMT family transporter [Saprospiraceae bacterium]